MPKPPSRQTSRASSSTLSKLFRSARTASAKATEGQCSPQEDKAAGINSTHPTHRQTSNGVRTIPRLQSLLQPRRRNSDVVPISSFSTSPQASTVGFYDVFGYLGVAMVVAFALSAMAMAFTTVVQIYPDEIANMLLQTQALDHGDFLMLSRPSMWIVVTSALMLLFFSSGYVALIAIMFSFRKRSLISSISHPSRTPSLVHRLVVRFIAWCRMRLTFIKLEDVACPTETAPRRRSMSSRVLKRTSSTIKHGMSTFLFEFTSTEGLYHEYYVAVFDFPKLVFQTVNMIAYMKKGFPLVLIFFFGLPLAFNWIISFYRFQRQTPDPALVITRVFYLFDLFFAVFAPIFALQYAYYNFRLDRGSFATREDAMTLGSFDTIARLFADPVQVEVFLQGFSNLQLTQPHYLAIKGFLNLLGIYKWKKVIVHLIVEKQLRLCAAVKPDPSTHREAMPHRHSKRHLFLGAVVFLFCSLGIAVYTVEAITTSIHRCSPFPKCAVFAYVWHVQSDQTCSCIVFIDHDPMPRTFDQWINADDITDQVRALAAAGTLETLQIINRALPTIPDELRGCRNLRTLILLYTSTQKMPVWSKEWTHLEYLHIEGDIVHYPLEYLPLDLFSNMQHLRFVRVGGASALPRFPSLTGKHRLTTLVTSIVRGLREFPSLDDLTGLKRLIIADATHMPVLPSLQHLESLQVFAVFRRNEVCCNGYATGYCDLNNFQCRKRDGEPDVQCVDARMSAEDHAVVERVDGFLCGKNITQDIDASEPTRLSTDGICEGVLYRECSLDGMRGICYNGRMQVVHCDVFGEYEKMRRLQIARGVGDACDPQVEAWLGCPRLS